MRACSVSAGGLPNLSEPWKLSSEKTEANASLLGSPRHQEPCLGRPILAWDGSRVATTIIILISRDRGSLHSLSLLPSGGWRLIRRQITGLAGTPALPRTTPPQAV